MRDFASVSCQIRVLNEIWSQAFVVYYGYMYANHTIQIQNTTGRLIYTGDSFASGTNVLSTSDFGSSTRGERLNSYHADHPIWPPQTRMASRGLISFSQLQLSPIETENPTVCLHGPKSTFNCFTLVMLSVPHWLLSQAHFCGCTHLPPSLN